jgi:hypothetical protein
LSRRHSITDRCADLLLLQLPQPLADDLFASLLPWQAAWSDGGHGWLIPRWALLQVRAHAARLSIALYPIDETRRAA